MTEKRFNDVKGYVYNKKNCIGFIQDEYTCENIINLLNAQHEEIQSLKLELELSKPLFSRRQLEKENEQLKQQLNKVFVLLDIKQKISKDKMEEWVFKDVPVSTTKEYYYSGMLDACMQLRDEILNGDFE